MSKYDPLWAHVAAHPGDKLVLTFEQIAAILGFPIDHAFLACKKELTACGWQVGRISMKGKTVDFSRTAVDKATEKR